LAGKKNLLSNEQTRLNWLGLGAIDHLLSIGLGEGTVCAKERRPREDEVRGIEKRLR
jgi:hypothetical protein